MDAAGKNCSETGQPVKTAFYEITLAKLITDVSVKTTILSKFSSKATLTAFLPGEDGTTKSSAPLSGKF